MGAENNIGKDEYILERKPSTSIKTIMEKMTVGFKHYYSQLNTGREITFAHLIPFLLLIYSIICILYLWQNK